MVNLKLMNVLLKHKVYKFLSRFVYMKSKGTRTERELLHMFHEAGFGGIRAAGSGSTTLPAVDLIVGNVKRHLAIECKSIKGKNKFLYPEDLEGLKEFSLRFGAEPWLGIRYDGKGWFFLKLESLKKNQNGNYTVSIDYALKNGFNFDQLIRGD